MNLKKAAVITTGAALLALGGSRELALGMSPQTAFVYFCALAILIVTLAAFTAQLRGAPIILWMTTIVVYDISLLIAPPMPKFLVNMFTLLALLAAFLYLSVDNAQLAELGSSLSELADSKNLQVYRLLLLALIPFWAAAVVLAKTGSELAAPVFPRSVHPAPPDLSDFKGKSYSLAELANPYRHQQKENPEKFERAVMEGKAVYYRNCYFCHGDHLNGLGPAAEALNPRPANFQDPGTIAMLQESFVFWRLTKGGPGMPPGGHPWNSAMPQWEKMLSEDEAWKVILWLYAYTDQSPRTWEKAEH